MSERAGHGHAHGPGAGRASGRAPRVDEELWTATLLASDTEALIGAARNYLGPVKTPYDKRELVQRLAAFLRRPDVREGVLALLDPLDARVLGGVLLAGPLLEAELRGLFAGELPLFDLGIRVANLLDRLLLFRFESGGRRLLAVNPLLAGDLAGAVLDPLLLFGAEGSTMPVPAPGGEPDPAAAAAAAEALAGAVDAKAAVAFFLFLEHAPGSLKKGGGLMKRAAERAASLFPGLAAGGAAQAASGEGTRFDAMARAFAAVGAFVGEEEGRPDPVAFTALAAEWGAALPALLAAALARSGEGGLGSFEERASLEAEARLLAAAIAAAPEGLLFSRGGFSRWLGLASRRAATAAPILRRAGSPGPGEGGAAAGQGGLFGATRTLEGAAAERLLAALLSLGLAVDTGGGLRLAVPWRGAAPAEAAAGNKPVLVAEGSHALHLMPEAGLEDRLFVGSLARPTAVGKVWSLELDRDSARRAFAAGLGAAAAIRRLESMAGRPLPQSLVFSFKSWEEEFRALRLYRGFVLVADERLRQLVERSERLAPYVAEKLAPGVYVLAVASPEEAEEVLRRAGLEAPPETRASAPRFVDGPVPEGAPPQAGTEGIGDRGSAGDEGRRQVGDQARRRTAELEAKLAEAVAPLQALAAGAGLGAGTGAGMGAGAARPSFDPRPRIESLKAALAGVGQGAGQGAGQAAGATGAAGTTLVTAASADVVRELQDRIERRIILSERQLSQAEARPERIEAGGLDYAGKVRIVERALRTSGDRLEVAYRLPGADPARALVRPARLEKTEKGLVLEAEDLATGGPVRIPLGAMSSVKRMRASLFGEEA
ncbi:MAG: hypothetical protein JNG85_10395 [Spirochaetaceae bacterium]|nr:hypothetical protein [Spirochaetaceae bacterium]